MIILKISAWLFKVSKVRLKAQKLRVQSKFI